MMIRKISKHTLPILICLIIEFFAFQMKKDNSDVWFYLLKEPSFITPKTIFTIGWTTTFCILGIIISMLSKRGMKHEVRLCCTTIALTLLWFLIFMNLKQETAGLIIALLNDIVASYLIYRTWWNAHTTSCLMIVNMIWLMFGTYINIGIVLSK